MGFMNNVELKAVENIFNISKCNEIVDKDAVCKICEKFHVDVELLVEKLTSCAVTINFHPDRLSNNGEIIINNLINDGKYHNQFITGTTNGGKTAYAGGDRDLWEKRLFNSIYHEQTIDSKSRPKYGALNIFQYLDGASPRFGSCFFTLKSQTLSQCTFAFGDSSTNPEVLGTAKSFYGILKSLLHDVMENGRLLNKENVTIEKALEYFLSIKKGEMQVLGKNLDYCIETHVHGDIDLLTDVDSFYLDQSFKNSQIEDAAIILSGKYNIALHWIPIREITIDSIADDFRGPKMKPLAKKIDLLYGNCLGIINAALIGTASRASILNPYEWNDIGNEKKLFQYFKQLWHTVAYFG